MIRLNANDCHDGGENLNKITWAIPESYLGILWDDVFQRMIVYLWFLDLSEAERKERQNNANSGDPPIRRHNNKKYRLSQEIDNQLDAQNFFSHPSVSKTFNVVPPTNESDGQIGRDYLIEVMKLMKKDSFSLVFKDYLKLLIKYFEGKDHVQPIPVYFLKGQRGGYDYILSSKGIELVFPRRPDLLDLAAAKPDMKFRRDVYELYAIRKTSTALLAVPPEFELNAAGRITAYLADQLRTVRLSSADNNIEELILEDLFVNITENEQQLIDSAVVPAELEKLIPLILDLVENVLKKLDNDFSCAAFDCKTFELPTNPCVLDYAKYLFCRIEECLKNLLNPVKEISFGCYTQALTNTRCWFLSGSVFRRIANEMPRLKARLWIDATLAAQFDRLNRYESNMLNGCRALFRESLEISLPTQENMFFRGLKIERDSKDKRLRDAKMNEYKVEPLPQGIVANGYRKNEIYIHDSGLLLPAVGEGPEKEEIYNAWKAGAAANPVFTDSGHCS